MSAPIWKVVRWENRPEDTSESIPLVCECGFEGGLPCSPLHGGKLLCIAELNSLLFEPIDFEPPANWWPNELECPRCGSRFIPKLEPEDS
jgi:hypothetical protein